VWPLGHMKTSLVYFNRMEQCLYFNVYGLQFSFHDILAYHEPALKFIRSSLNKPQEWSNIPLRSVASEIFHLATMNYAGGIDVSASIVRILNLARKRRKHSVNYTL